MLTGDLAQAMAVVAEEEAIAEATAAATASGSGQLIANVHQTAAVLHNGLADYSAALTAAQEASAHGDLLLAGLALPELTVAGGTASGLGIAAYARGLVTGGEEHYAEAIERLQDRPPTALPGQSPPALRGVVAPCGAAGGTVGCTCAPPKTCSPGRASTHSPGERPMSWVPAARRPAAARGTRKTN